MNIIFFGEDSFSNIVLLSLLQTGYTISLIVTPVYNNMIHKRLENTALKNGIEYERKMLILKPSLKR